MNKEAFLNEVKAKLASVRHSALVIHVLSEILANHTIPAIDWKPINITQMKVGRNYLLWDECHVCPIAGFMDASGDLIKLSSGRVLNDVTHYAEFNKPEGVE